MRLYQMQDSGNCYKVRLLCRFTKQPIDLIDIDILAGETRQDEFLLKNPNGRVPLLELDDGRFLAESNAILHYLAAHTNFWPADRYAQAETLQWMFFEQYSHEPFIAVARFWWSLKPGGRTEQKNKFPEWHDKGHAALSVMDKHLSQSDFFVGGTPTIADIALFAYTHVAPEGGFDISGYKNIGDWLGRVRTLDGFAPITER